MNMEERLQAVVAQAEVDGIKWHTIVHGDESTVIDTNGGKVPSAAKQMKDIREAITGGVLDVVEVVNQAKNETLDIKSETQSICSETSGLRGETLVFRNEAENFKNQAQSSFNNLTTAMNVAIGNVESTAGAKISQVQSAGAEQIAEVISAGEEQTANAEAQADRALYYAQCVTPAPLGSKLTVPASTKIPDGYEPVWYKNTITRARYPDFFEKLADTDALIFVPESVYNAQVATYGMCASYVRVDYDTLILPLLVNYGRGGNKSQLGLVQNDQFQGHWHEMVYRQDSTSSGFRSDIFGTDGFTGSAVTTSTGTDEWMQHRGDRKADWLCAINPLTDYENGTPRVGDETRPKSYYELTYIKCADVTRTLAVEETTSIRNEFVQRTTHVLECLEKVVQIVEEQRGINGYIKYSDGRMEQWGRIIHAGTSWITTPFPIPFFNNDINMSLTCVTPASLGSGTPAPQVRYDVDKNRFIWHIPGGNGWNAYWRAYGEWK